MEKHSAIIAGQMNGKPVNYSGIGRDALVSTKTIQEYYSILVDMMVSVRINGWSQSVRKQMRSAPKYYFFDCGVLNAIRGEIDIQPRPGTYRYGMLFETCIIQECVRLNDYFESGYEFFYWQTNSGVEVDLIAVKKNISEVHAVEIKSETKPRMDSLH